MADSPLSLLWDATRLRLLVEIDRQGSVSAAARAIGIGQPSASEHLRLLEARRRAAARRAERPRQPPHRGRTSCSPSTPARRCRPSRAGEEELRRARRPRGRDDPHRRLDDPRRLPAPRHARLLPPRPP